VYRQLPPGELEFERRQDRDVKELVRRLDCLVRFVRVQILAAQQSERREAMEDEARRTEFTGHAVRPRVAHPGDDAARPVRRREEAAVLRHGLAELGGGDEEVGHEVSRRDVVGPLAAIRQAGFRARERDRGDRDAH